MNNEEKYKIVSNDFADLIIHEFMLKEVLTTYANASVTRINNVYSIVYVPVENMTSSIIYSVGYEAIPKCYGLMSVPCDESLGVAQLPNIIEPELSEQGVLVGFVDTGIDYRNQAFQYADHTSRIVSIWDQTIDSENNVEDFDYGTEFRQEQINIALGSENPLSIVPSMDEIGHGTTLAGIAGGSFNEESGFRGVAPNVEFVVVKLKPAKPYLMDFFQLPQDTICFQEDDIILGVKYLIQVAKELNRPISICIGLGSTQGAYLGLGIMNDYLSTMGLLGNVAIVVAAGNEGNSGHHFFGEINPTIGYNVVELNVGDNEPEFLLKFVVNAPNALLVDLFTPTGEFIGHIPPYYKQQSTMQFQYLNTMILVDNTVEYSLTGDQFISFRFQNPQRGIWRFRVSGIGNLISKYHIWLPISGFITPGTFFIKSNTYSTITNPGNEETVLTVTAYNNVNQTLYYSSSKGFPTENNIKPDIAAPGVNIWAPTINNQYAWNSGTSVAAAHTTGMVAMLLEWGLLRGNMKSMPSAMIRSLVTGGARRLPVVTYPNPDWGFGILDIYNSILLAEGILPNY